MSLFIGSLALTTASGCQAFERWACGEPCRAENRPADGAPEDFTLAGARIESAEVTAPFVCDHPGEELGGETRYAARVRAEGDDDELDTVAWMLDRLLPELAAADLSVTQTLVDCGLDERPLALATSDWRTLDAIAQTVARVADEDDIAVEVLLVVEPRFGACPDEACGA